MSKLYAVVSAPRFNDVALFASMMRYFEMQRPGAGYISTKVRGASHFIINWCKNHNLPIEYIVADWDYYGRSANGRRNDEIVARAAGVIAFYDGVYRDTKHLIDLAKTKGLDVWVVDINTKEVTHERCRAQTEIRLGEPGLLTRRAVGRAHYFLSAFGSRSRPEPELLPQDM